MSAYVPSAECRRPDAVAAQELRGHEFLEGLVALGDVVHDVLAPRAAARTALELTGRGVFLPSGGSQICLAVSLVEPTRPDTGSRYSGARRTRRAVSSARSTGCTTFGVVDLAGVLGQR